LTIGLTVRHDTTFVDVCGHHRPSAACPPVTVCNCFRPSLHHCWCSVVQQFANRHCCVWHTVTVPPST